MNVAQSSLSLL